MMGSHGIIKQPNSLPNSNFKKLATMKKSVRRYMFWLELCLICVYISKRKLLINSFFKAQFSYCPLVWMCHSGSMNNKFNRMHERCHWITYHDKMLFFADLLAKDRSITIHTRNSHVLAAEMFKVHKNMSTEPMQGRSCARQTNYNLRNLHHFAIPSVNCA